MNRPWILFIVDGGPEYGLGHLRRSMALATVFRIHGFAVRMEGKSEASREYLGEVSDGPSPSVVIIDLPYDGDPTQRQVRRMGVPVVGLDYLGRLEPDLQIGVLEQAGWARGEEILVGLEFAVIREFPQPPKHGEGVVVCIGGADVRRIGPKAAQALHDLGESVTLLRGPFSHGNLTDGNKYTTLINPPDFEAHLAGCRWAVTNGGTTMLEAMSLGKPVHVIPQTAAETRLADHILQRGGILGIGLGELRSPAPSYASQTGLVASRLVDGKGAERIVAAITARWLHTPEGCVSGLD